MAGVSPITEKQGAEGLSPEALKPTARPEPVASVGAFIPLATTTQCPPVASRRIRRERLLQQLQAAAGSRLILIKGPAGYGKTTLAVDWGAELHAAGQRTAWVRAEQENSESSVFLQYVAIAIEQACPGAGRPALDLLEANRVPPLYAIVAALINALVESGEELYLFIDDYHLVDTPEIRDAVCFLLKHAPRHFRIVITTREVPVLPLGTLRARGELFEIDAGELRFSLEETARLFQSEHFTRLDEATVNALQRDTGGWAAALRMACSLLRAGVAPEASLWARHGGMHAMEEYLEDVLARLPTEVYEFMLATSILKSLFADLCQEVTGDAHSEEVLETLFRRYQLLNREGNEPASYSYHPLVADHLGQQLKKRAPEKFHEFHRRAAHWFVRHERIVDAIRHAVSAGECALAATWTEQCAMQLIKEGKIGTVLGWRRWLPKELTRNQLSLRVALGWSLFLASQRKDALAWIDEIEADVAAGLPDPNGRAVRECLAIRVGIHGFDDAAGRSLALGQRYMENTLPDPWINNVVGNCIFFGHLMADEREQADAFPWQELARESGSRMTSTQIYRLCLAGMAFARRLRFSEAQARFEEAMAVAVRDRGHKSSLSAIPATFLAHQFYELNRIDEAEAMLRGRLDAINASGFLDCELRAYVVLTRIAYRNNDNALAHQMLDQAERIAVSEAWPRMQAGLLVERLRLFIDEGNLSAAAGCLARLASLAAEFVDSKEPACRHVRGYLKLANAYMEIRAGRFALAAESLETLWLNTIASAGRHFAVRIGSLQAAALFADGQPAAALSRFAEVLSFAVPAGVIRTIVDNGPEIGPLIAGARRQAAGEGGDAVIACYLAQLERVFAESWNGVNVRPLAVVPAESQLTTREGDVLRLIAGGQSNKEIARLIQVSPETVKWHIKNIFIKLGVDNRLQAVASGRRQGLFE